MPRPPTPESIVAPVIADMAAGMTARDAAKKHGVNRNTAAKWRKAAGIPLTPNRGRPVDPDSASQIAARSGRSKRQILRERKG
jgi:transposase-like protein